MVRGRAPFNEPGARIARRRNATGDNMLGIHIALAKIECCNPRERRVMPDKGEISRDRDGTSSNVAKL